MQEILIENQKIKSEFDRWCNHFQDHDPYDTNETVGLLDVLRSHFLIADYFYTEDYGIGGIGPKSTDLLHSSIYRQFVSYAGVDKWKSPYERCATLVYGIIKDHPFHDANKRTALLSLLYFLDKINRYPTVNQKELEDLVVEVGENNLKKYSRYKEFRKKSTDPEVYFLADYLKRNSRNREFAFKAITFNQLNNCLKRHNYFLDNPRNGNIELFTYVEKRVSFLGKKQTVAERVIGGIPFQQGWKSQVSKSIVSKVRDAAKLTPHHGVDSAAFYGEVDPLYVLIDQYKGPLQRLAFR